MKLLTLPAVLLFAVLPAFADSFNVFMLEVTPDGHQTQIQLTPNGNPLFHSFGPPFEVDFEVPTFQPILPEDTISIDLFLAGHLVDTFGVTQDCSTPPSSLVCGFGVAMNAAFFPKTVNGVVTVTINDQSETFNFRYSSISTVVPEPTSLSLLGMGLAAVVWRKHRRASGHSPGHSP